MNEYGIYFGCAYLGTHYGYSFESCRLSIPQSLLLSPLARHYGATIDNVSLRLFRRAV